MAELASSADDLDCLDVFARLLSAGRPESGHPLLLTVLVEPLAGAQNFMAGNVRPGTIFRVDEDLQVRLTRAVG